MKDPRKSLHGGHGTSGESRNPVGGRAEACLPESEERFRLAADTAVVLIWMAGADRRCDFLSQGWIRFTGRGVEQELGDGWIEGVHPDDRQRLQGEYESAFRSRSSFVSEYRLRRADGAW